MDHSLVGINCIRGFAGLYITALYPKAEQRPLGLRICLSGSYYDGIATSYSLSYYRTQWVPTEVEYEDHV